MGSSVSVRLSQCMIVKNEEKNIERALSWGRDIVCEQIVVDTGSEDKTVELAERMGAKVFHFPWVDDFSAAKNYAIDQATGDWIAFLDADEYFSQEDAGKLIPLLEQLHGNCQINLITTKWVHLKADGGIIGVSNQVRIFQNSPGLRYRNRIHETLDYQGEGDVVNHDAQDALMIFHTGYGAQTNNLEKGLRNARLLKLDLAEHPEDMMLRMYLGDAFNMAKEKGEALNCYRQVLRKTAIKEPKDEIAFLRSGLQLLSILIEEPDYEEQEDEVLDVIQKLWEDGFDSHPDVDFFTGIYHAKKGQLGKAAKCLEGALQKMKLYRGAEMCRMTPALSQIHEIIGKAALKQNDLPKAIQHSLMAIQYNKYTADAIRTLLKVFLVEFRQKGSAVEYWHFLCKLYDRENLKDLIFLYKFAKEVGFSQLAELIYEALPAEVKNEGIIH